MMRNEMENGIKSTAKVVAIIFFYLLAVIAVVVVYRSGWFSRPLAEARVSDLCWLAFAHGLYTRWR